MSPDLITLLRRDHQDLERGLAELVRPGIELRDLRSALDGVRLGLTAHVMAADIVVGRALGGSGAIAAVGGAELAKVQEVHRSMRHKLAALICETPRTSVWVEFARQLLAMVVEDASLEESTVAAPLRQMAPELYNSLAGKYATERLKQLAMLQPSAPIYMADLARMA